MSDYMAWLEAILIKAKALLVDDPEINDKEFERIVLQLRRMREGTWKAGQV